MVSIGDVCPIIFEPLEDDFSNGCYLQKFLSVDNILVQFFSDSGENVTAILNNKTRETSSAISLSTYDVNDKIKMFYAVIRLSDGVYSISYNNIESQPFEVADSYSEPLCQIQYSHKDNSSAFDNIFWIGTNKQTFTLRIEGGFKPSGVSFSVENEQFRNQKQELVELYSMPSKKMVFTIGSASGVPVSLLELVNKILCLSDIKINGKNYVRSESSTPEITEVMEGYGLFNANVTLEPLNNNIMGIGGKMEERSIASIPAFAVNSPNDGEVLVYDGETNAWTNRHILESI